MKMVCIYHSIDLDGWMSAAIVKHWYKKEHYGNTLEHGNVIVDPNEGVHSLTFIGYNYGQPIPDLSEYDKVIMCDISFPKEEMDKLHWNFRENFIWNDHHISAIKDSLDYSYSKSEGLKLTNFAACELTWKYFFPNEPMPEIVRLLGRYDCFGHKGTNEELEVLEFQYGARQIISNYEEAYSYLTMSIEHISYEPRIEEKIRNSGKAIYSYLCTEAKQIYKNGFEITFNGDILNDDGWSYRCPKFLAINRERFNPVNFGIDYHKDGYDGCACFHYANGMWNFSLYNDNGEVDCSTIAKQYGGGGHKNAAGFKIKDINIIIK